MRYISLVLLFFSFITISNSQIDISQARSMALGETVTIEGVATNGGELGIIRYLQDASGAVAVYPGSGSVGDFPGDVKRGDIVQVTGELKEFNGLLEVDPVMSYTIMSSNNPLPDPIDGTPNDLAEDNEAKLMTIPGVKFDNGGGVFSVGNFTFSSETESGEIYVRSNHPLLGTEVPLATIDLTGIVSQFNSIYQLLPRGTEDIIVKDNFFLTSSPQQSNISKDGFTVSWETNTEANAIVRYGTTDALGEEVVDNTMSTSHSIDLSGLDAGEFYFIEVASNNGTSEVISTQKYFATASESTGEIRVYFNHDVDGSFSNGHYPNGNSGLIAENAIIDLIDNAQTSIDMSIYNINRDRIVNALETAHNRGIVVRYIADDDTANLALSDPRPSFPIIRGNVNGLMHNKFMIVDAESINDSWIMSGSMNLTQQNIVNDYNNMILIQDVALAKAYTIEFEEMWGTDGPNPGIFNVKFSSDKRDNTPHHFLINDILVESYFSPTDNTTIAISNNLANADNDIQFSLLTFTNNELGTAIANAYNRGIDIRGVIDNINDQGGEYPFLSNIGVNVTPDNTTTQTHHKYCIIDANDSSSDPTLVTGSHNWSGGAETRNDENTLIFHDETLVNLYLQEFEARWCEVQGSANCTTSNNNVEVLNGITHNIFPNPTSDELQIALESETSTDLSFSILTLEGRVIQSNIKRNVQGNVQFDMDLSIFPAGNYILQIGADNQRVNEIIQIIK